MKRKEILVLSVLLAVPVLFSVTAMSAGRPPIALYHNFQGHISSGDMHIWNFELMVQNPTDTPIYNLVLTIDHTMWLPVEEFDLIVGDLAAREIRKLPFSITTVVLLDESSLRELPFLWRGQYAVTDGQVVEVTIESLSSMEGGSL
jgi:hypothetical protein